MYRRFLRSAVVFAVLIAAYNAYALLAVPLMEPTLTTRTGPRVDPYEIKGGANVSQYQLLLSNYFPKDHWSQVRAPKVIANSGEQAMLVFDDFKRRPGSAQNADGSSTTLVDIERIAFLIFPTPPREGIVPPSDAIILEAPRGAHLEFNDFRPEIGKIGQIIRGEFPGLIRIRSEMRDPKPEDDLLIETADMQMNTKLMFTNAPVRFRMGENAGGGTELEIRFLADEHMKPSDPGLKIGGVDSLEIRRDVKMRLTIDSRSLLPGGKTETSSSDTTPAQKNPKVQVSDVYAVAPQPQPPMEVTCSGPFTFDFVRYVASLDRDVELRQVNPNGPSDQLICSRLDIHFAPKLQSAGAAKPVVDPGKRQQRDLSQLEPVAIVAEGHPVVMTSPQREAQARGDRIQIALRDQRIRISGGNDAMLVYGPNVLQAPVIDYQHPTPDEATKVGRFRATGPGSLRYSVETAKPNDVLQAQWQTSVQLGREKGQPVLLMDGRPKVSLGAAGSLAADEIRMYLRELVGDGTEGIAIGGKGDKPTSQLRLAPDRLIATGSVEVVSPQFTGRTKQLSTSFRLQSPTTTAPHASGAEKANQPAAPPNEVNPLNAVPEATSATQTYYIESDRMQLEVTMKGQTASPVALACEGQIVVREIPLVPTTEQPLEVHGGQLMATQLDTKAPHIMLRGGTDGTVGVEADQRAQIVGRGMRMLVDKIEADGGTRVWSDGAGKATLLISQDMTGQKASTPFPMDVTWQKGFRFDGQTITFDQDIVVSGMDSTLRCDQLAAKLATKVQFGQRMDQLNMNPSEIECRGRVAIENVTRDAVGVTSHSRVELGRLSINQQTGVIAGDGPGTIRATRFGNGMVAIAGQSGTATLAAAPTTPAGNKLYFLRVDFHRGLDGNMYLRDLTFQERVRTVYGPVDAWEQELEPAKPESLPPDSIQMTCDALRLNEDPMAARLAQTPADGGKRPVGPVQMVAAGDVRISGQLPSQGEYSVQADRASYDDSKKMFVLEGDTRTPAKLWRRNAGVDAPPTEARKIRYVTTTGEVRVEGIQFFEITPRDLQNATRPKAPAR